MPTVIKSLRQRSGATPDDGGASVPIGRDISSDAIDRYRQIATMIARLGRLPEIGEDIKNRRLPNPAAYFAHAPQGENDEILRAYGELSPLMQRAFMAVVAGLDKLAESAVDLYDHTHRPPTSDEIRAGAEIGRAMRQLLERAMAIVEGVSAQNGAGRPRAKDAPAARNGRRRH